MKTLKKITTILIYILNLVILIVPFVLEYFGDKKMMMNRYLISKDKEFEAIFTNGNINLLRVVFVVFLIVGIWILIKKNIKVRYASILVVFFSVLGIVFTVNDFSLKAYYFVLISVIVNSLLSIINLGINMIPDKN